LIVPTVGIDAMILVYAGIVPSKALGASQLADLHVRAMMLLDQLARDDALVILPTVAIAELLVPVPPADSGLLIRALAEQFICPTFDLPAAAIAANLWAEHKKLPRDQQYKDRHVLKADAMIIASAKAAGATDFYSNDQNCRKLAGLVMGAHGLPTKARDLEDVFVEADIKSGEQPPPIRRKPKKKNKK
jgi:hypothetical protein